MLDPNYIILYQIMNSVFMCGIIARKYEVNAHKTKYMIVSRDQNAGRIHSMKIDDSSIERVEEFK